MSREKQAYRGCLLGLAVGDAMGYTVDHKSWDEIRRNYGPNGLLGYDLVNGYAETTSYTQIAAMAANGLLMGTTRGQIQGRMAPFIRYITAALQEWNNCQHTRREPARGYCWISKVPELRRRRCMDTRMLDTLNRGPLGTPEEPVNDYTSTGMITAPVAVGLFFDPQRMQFSEIGRLGAEVIALTHGNPMAFLPGAVLAYTIAGIIQGDGEPLAEQFRLSADAVAAQFGREYPQANAMKALVERTIAAAEKGSENSQEAMELLRCDENARVLVGAMYACLRCGGDFDAAMITAVNHSGCSSAVAAVCGAILGAYMTEDALPEFYMESLECVDVLRVLADDLAQGCPLERSARLFDDDWDRKYLHAERTEQIQWSEE